MPRLHHVIEWEGAYDFTMSRVMPESATSWLVSADTSSPSKRRTKERLLAELQRGPDDSGFAVTFWFWTILLLLCATVVLIPLAVKGYRHHRRRTRELQPLLEHARAFAGRAEVVVAFPLMVTSILHHPQTESGTGLVLISFDPAADGVDLMTDLAQAVGLGDAEGWGKQERDWADRLMSDEQWQACRRRRLPDAMTGGPVVYACDLVIEPLMLPGHYVGEHAPLLLCLAEPGHEGCILHMPYWMVGEGQEPTQEERAAFWRMMLLTRELEERRRASGA